MALYKITIKLKKFFRISPSGTHWWKERHRIERQDIESLFLAREEELQTGMAVERVHQLLLQHGLRQKDLDDTHQYLESLNPVAMRLFSQITVKTVGVSHLPFLGLIALFYGLWEPL